MSWWAQLKTARLNPEKFWSDYHRQRREKRMLYWRKRADALARQYGAAVELANYYEKKLGD